MEVKKVDASEVQTESTAQTESVSQQTGTGQARSAAVEPPRPVKFCSHCGGKIDKEAVICPLCGCQVEQMAQSQAQPQAAPNIIINNANTNTNTNMNQNGYMPMGKPKNKWVAILLCIFLGIFGAHKFYEGKIGMGILYLFTLGLLGIGVVVDLIRFLFKPNPYYV